ncbi:MAG: polysaccharide biosynthesis protein [Firmicutes bacterium]|nr:polysaccharide biosynthesis protein [Bacillota bacterium]
MARQSFLHGALVLTLAGLISKVLGVLYRIPFARFIGAEGIGLYQMAYPIYSLVLALSTAGVPVAISMLVAEKRARGDHAGANRVFWLALVLLSFTGLLMTWILVRSAGYLAVRVLHDPRAYYPLLVISPAIFLGAVMSVFRGFFQGRQVMGPTARSQVLEQVVRVGTILALSWWLLPLGIEFAAAGATFGAVTGAAAGLLVLVFSFRRGGTSGGFYLGEPEGKLTTMRRLFGLAVPISLGALVMPVAQTLDAFVVPLRLQDAGYSISEATQLFGQLSGMAGTLINLPSVLTIALATALVPMISGAVVHGRTEAIVSRLDGVIKLTLLLCLPVSVGFYLLSGPICGLLYNLPAAGVPLQALAPAVLFLGLYQVTAAVLQGLGKPGKPMRNLILAAILKLAVNYYLVGQPLFGIRGAALATGLAFAFASGMNLVALYRELRYRVPWETVLLKPLAAVTIMAALIKVYQWQTGGPHGGLETIGLIALSGMGYGLSALLLGAVEQRELSLIPRVGPRLATWLCNLRLVRG